VKKRYLIGGGILVAAVAYLLSLSFGSSVSYYVTVSEFYDRGTELHNTNLRMAGNIADSPVSPVASRQAPVFWSRVNITQMEYFTRASS